MEKITASLITIGDELLIGQTIDTNSAWMAQQLNVAGIWVQRRVAVGDDRDEIIRVLEEEGRRCHIILITGGLGPTADDITKPVLCEYFGGQLVENAEALERINRIFEGRGLPVLKRNLQQAMVPDVANILQNERGTAPGMWFEKDGKVFVSMPGVPFEMKGMMEATVLPLLKERFRTPALLHHTLITTGMGESFVAERLEDFEAQLPPHMKLAYLPSYGLLKLRLTTIQADQQAAVEELNKQFIKMNALLGDIAVAEQDLPMSVILSTALEKRKLNIGTAESCTGGMIASMITSIPGSSQRFKGAIVSYANEVKTDVLGVQPSTLEQYGAVSEQTVREMAEGALKLLKTDTVIAVSGIMGPDGGSEEKPVGTVWMAVGGPGKIHAVKYHFRYDRTRNTEMTCVAAMNELRKWLEL